jgi:predicted secreted Zn-dependent protease
MTVHILLPDWSPPPDAPAALAERWGRFLSALRLHEEGHRELAVREGYEVLQAITGVRGPCAGMDDAVQAAAGGVSASYRQRHGQYDAQTQHGAGQGAVFP